MSNLLIIQKQKLKSKNYVLHKIQIHKIINNNKMSDYGSIDIIEFFDCQYDILSPDNPKEKSFFI